MWWIWVECKVVIIVKDIEMCILLEIRNNFFNFIFKECLFLDDRFWEFKGSGVVV